MNLFTLMYRIEGDIRLQTLFGREHFRSCRCHLEVTEMEVIRFSPELGPDQR